MVSVIYNYILSVRWVFEVDENGDKRKEFVIFIVLSLIGLGLNQLLMWVFVSMIHIFYMVAKIIVTAIVMLYNFITRKLFLESMILNYRLYSASQSLIILMLS